MQFIGIDLAWGSKNTTAVAVLEGSRESASHLSLLAYESALLTNKEILDFLAPSITEKSGILVSIDAPTCVPNLAGRRPCEAALASVFQKYAAGPHPANRTLLANAEGEIRGEVLVKLLEAKGITHTPFFTGDNPQSCFEVYPHPAHVVFFVLSRILPYKAKPKRTKETRLAAFSDYANHLQNLQNPAIGNLSSVLRTVEELENLNGPALKRYEDLLDAITCAYIAAFAYYHPQEIHVFGDLETGHILTPRLFRES